MTHEYGEHPALTLEDFKSDLSGVIYPEEIVDKLIGFFYQHIEIECREWAEQEFGK